MAQAIEAITSINGYKGKITSYAVTLRENIDTDMFEDWKNPDPSTWYNAREFGSYACVMGSPHGEPYIITKDEFDKYFDVMERTS